MRLPKIFSAVIAVLTLFVGMGVAQRYEQPTFSATFTTSNVKFSQQEGTTDTADKTTFTYNQWASQTDSTFFGVAYADYTTVRSNTVENLNRVLTGEVDAVFEAGTITQDLYSTSIGRLEGRGESVTGTLKGTKTRAYLYSKAAVIGNRLWQVMYFTTIPTTKDVASPYLDSVVIN